MLEYKPREELYALIKRQEEELSAMHRKLAAVRVALAELQSRMGGVLLEKAGAAPCKPAETVDMPELPPLRVITQLIHDAGVLAADESHYNVATTCLTHTARAVAAAVEKERASGMDTIRDRDQYHEWADKLADAISVYFVADIGEHSSANCPWARALDVIEEAEPIDAQPVAGALPPLHVAAQNVVAQFCDPHVSLASVARYINELGDVLAAQPVQQPAAVVSLPIEMSQFLTDVITAAGLVSSGRRDKGLAKRISRAAFALLTAPVRAAGVQGDDGSEAVRLLGLIFDAWENGDECYENPENSEGFLGNAFRLDDDVFKQCCDLLNRRDPPRNAEPKQPDSGRDAALVTAATELLENVSFDYESPIDPRPFIKNLRAALAAHPAPSSDAALVQQLREYAGNAGYSHNDYADTMRQAAEALAAHPANGAQADTQAEINAVLDRADAEDAARYPDGAQAGLSEAARAVIAEAAQVLESAAAHNRSKSRTVLAHTQQERADRLREVFLAAAPQKKEG